METVETAAPMPLVSSESESAANVESAAEELVDAAMDTFNFRPCAITNVTTIMSGNMIEEAAQLSPTPCDDATDASVTGTATTSRDTGSARQETANSQASLSFVDRVDTAISSTTTTTQQSADSLDHGTSANSPFSGDDDDAANGALLSDHGSENTAGTTTETTTTELSNSLAVSCDDTDKDSSVYVQALLSTIATFPSSIDDRSAIAAALVSDTPNIYRLPNGKLVTAKNTLRSYSTAAAVAAGSSSSTNHRNSASDHGDEDESHHVRGVPVSVSPPSSATSSPILINVVHATQDHAGNASSPPPPILAAVVSGLNEPTNTNETGGNNGSGNKSKFKKVRIGAVAMFAILAIAVTLFVAFDWSEGTPVNENPGPSVTAPGTNASQSRATAVTNYINNIKLSTDELDTPTFQYQYDSGEQAALDWLVNFDPLQLWPDSDMNKFRLKQRYALLTLLLQVGAPTAISFDGAECEWIYVMSCASEPTESLTMGANVVTGMGIDRRISAGADTSTPGLTLPPDVGLLSNLVTFRIENTTLLGSLPSSLGTAWTNLKEIHLSGNSLIGSIPPTWGTAWTNLTYFDVSNNALTGSLPSSLGTTWTNLATFDVSLNNLTGSLPSLLGTAWTNLATFLFL